MKRIPPVVPMDKTTIKQFLLLGANKKRLRIHPFVLLTLLLISLKVEAQVYVFTGVHENYVRNKVLANESPLTSFHVGGGVRFVFSEKRPKTILNAEFAIARKGYNQTLGGNESEFHFTYLTYQATLGHQILPWMSVKGGVNLATLVDVNLKRWYQTYRMVDVGLVAGLDFLETKRIGFYSRVVYGLVPMIKYDNIDATGNFNGTIRDLRNTCVMIGFRIKLNEKEFHFRH